MMKRYYAEGVMSRHATELFELFKRNRHDWQKLIDKRVLVAGAGGLGSFVVAQLIGSGVKEIHVADHDVVEPHNLNRQFFFGLRDIGRKKVEVLVEKLRDRPARIVGIDGRVEDVNIDEYDVVLDCLDEWKTKMWLIEEGRRKGVPIVFMSVGRGKGLVSVPSRPFPFNPPRGCVVSSPEIAVTSGIGVSEALRILEGKEPLLKDKLLVFDIESLSWEILDLT